LEEQIIIQQDEFKSTIESLTRSVSQFHTYSKKDQHIEISEKVRYINEALANAASEARKYNSREHLFER
jgi:aminoglycoside phosphotransferase family enzyme